MFPAISSPACHVHFSNMFASQKKRTLQGWFSRKVVALTTLGVSSHGTKFDCNQAACWALALFGGAEEWMDEANRGNSGKKFLRIWMDSFLVFAIKFSVLQRCSLMVGRLFFVYFFSFMGQLFLDAFKLDTSHFDHRWSPASEDESGVQKFMFLAYILDLFITCISSQASEWWILQCLFRSKMLFVGFLGETLDLWS